MVAVSFCAAASGAFATLLLKLVSEALSDVVVKQEAWSPGPAALSLVCLAFFSPFELYLLNSLIAGSPVTFAVPIYESLLIVLNVTMGGTFFEELAHLDDFAGAFVAGVLLVGLGVCLLSLDHAPEASSPIALEEGSVRVCDKTDAAAHSDGLERAHSLELLCLRRSCPMAWRLC